MRTPTLLAVLAALALPQAAAAGTPVTLNARIEDPDGHVTLGELFDDAGPARGVAVAERIGPTLVLDAQAVQAFARRYGLDWDNPAGISRIIVRGDPNPGAPRNREILTYAHNLDAGEIVQGSDLVWAKAAADPAGAPRGAEAVIGMAARRPLKAGDPVLAHDVAPPLVIKAGDTVEVVYAAGGVTLTLQGKALANAAAGDSFGVLNTSSKKVIEAVATGADTAVVGPEAQRLKAERTPAQIALR
jgi:flagella basal body P-ring formation protein FlgA